MASMTELFDTMKQVFNYIPVFKQAQDILELVALLNEDGALTNEEKKAMVLKEATESVDALDGIIPGLSKLPQELKGEGISLLIELAVVFLKSRPYLKAEEEVFPEEPVSTTPP